MIHMKENTEFNKELIEEHFKYKKAVIGVPFTKFSYTGRKEFYHYGSVLKVTDTHIILLEDKGLVSIPFENILSITKGD